MGYVPSVGFATYCHATVKIRLYFKRLMFMQMFCILKKKWPSQQMVSEQFALQLLGKVEV
jgi:hypothetical protein